MSKTFIPNAFQEKYSNLMGKESAEFFDYCKLKWPKSIWVNSLKIKPELLVKELRRKGWNLEELFHENSFSLKGINRPGQSEQFKEGLFNVQEKSSMLPSLVLNPGKKDLVLDATAAPGNKTLQLSCLMNGAGKIVAVEKNVQRFRSLRFNVKKFGMKNVILKRMDLLDGKKTNLFDKVLLDAPCSSEGLVRKDYDALKNWNNDLVNKKAELQKKLIVKGFGMLKEGGELVYSTCSLSPEENESVVQSLIESGKAEISEIKINDFKTRRGLIEYKGTKYDSSLKKCVRIYPQDNDSQAFFVAKLTKTST